MSPLKLKICLIYFSIKEMAENIRFAIEKEEKLQEEILLKDKDFVVDVVRTVFLLYFSTCQWCLSLFNLDLVFFICISIA